MAEKSHWTWECLLTTSHFVLDVTLHNLEETLDSEPSFQPENLCSQSLAVPKITRKNILPETKLSCVIIFLNGLIPYATLKFDNRRREQRWKVISDFEVPRKFRADLHTFGTSLRLPFFPGLSIRSFFSFVLLVSFSYVLLRMENCLVIFHKSDSRMKR